MVTLLRRRGQTVDELAAEVGLTNNGVRAHLATLERDGLVTQQGSVRSSNGGGKPAYVYELTQEAEGLFPKAYEPTLRQLLDVLSDQLGPEESEALLRLVGRRLAGEHPARSDGAHARLESAVEGYSCPLAGVTTDHPELCRMAETMIAELAGVPVHECCDRGERPRCCFEIASADGVGQK
jgi:predicted ArsR family transcriptional regulator